MFKAVIYSFVLAAFVSSSCVAMHEFKIAGESDKLLYHRPWKPNFVIKPSVLAALLSRRPSCDEAVCAEILSYLANPLDEVIAAVQNRPVDFGKNVEKYRFHERALKGRPSIFHHRQIFEAGGHTLKLDASFESGSYSIEGLHPGSIMFFDIEQTRASVEGNKNIVTQAALFVANAVAKYERENECGPGDKLAKRSVAIPTKSGIYYAHAVDNRMEKDVVCYSEERFRGLSRFMSFDIK